MTTLHALIVAAGRGSRFGATLPKQYWMFDFPDGKQKSVLECSVEALAAHHEIVDCTLVLAADDVRARNMCFPLSMHYVVGGAERWQSVAAGVRDIVVRGAADDDLVVIHDAARPCLGLKDLQAVIAAAKNQPYGAILGVPVVDTLKKVRDDGTAPMIAHTVSREDVWQVQTPQVFRLKALMQVIEFIECSMTPDTASFAVTDEAMGFEALGLPVCMVRGSRNNIKLTYADEVSLMAALLQLKS